MWIIHAHEEEVRAKRWRLRHIKKKKSLFIEVITVNKKSKILMGKWCKSQIKSKLGKWQVWPRGLAQGC